MIFGGRFSGKDRVKLHDSGLGGVRCGQMDQCVERALSVAGVLAHRGCVDLVAKIEHGVQERDLVGEVVQEARVADSRAARDITQ